MQSSEFVCEAPSGLTLFNYTGKDRTQDQPLNTCGAHPNRPCSELRSCYCIDCDRLNFHACLDIDITGEVTAAVTVCPRADYHENRQKIPTCICQDVLVARGLFRIKPLFQQAILSQRFQPLCEHCWRDAKAFPELVETGEPCMGVSENENAPCIPYIIETPSNWAQRNRTIFHLVSFR